MKLRKVKQSKEDRSLIEPLLYMKLNNTFICVVTRDSFSVRTQNQSLHQFAFFMSIFYFPDKSN